MLKTNEKQFTEEDFVFTLFTLLCKKRVYKLNIEDLEKKLYFYYCNKDFKKLFQDIELLNGKVNLHKGIKKFTNDEYSISNDKEISLFF